MMRNVARTRRQFIGTGLAAIGWAICPREAMAALPKLKLIAEFQGHEDSIYSIWFSGDSKTLVSSANDETVRFWTIPEIKEKLPIIVRSPKDEKTMIRCAKDSGVPFIGFLPDGKTLLVADVRDPVLDARKNAVRRLRIRHWDVASRKECTPAGSEVELPANWGIRAISADGKLLMGTFLENDQQGLRLCERLTGKVVAVLQGIGKDCGYMAMSMDAKKFAVTRRHAGTIDVWDFNSKDVIATITPRMRNWNGLLSSGQPEGITFSPNGRLVAAPCRNGCAQVWNAETGKLVRLLETDESTSRVTFSADGGYLASSGGKYLRIWDLKGAEVACLAPISGEIRVLVFSPCGKYVAGAFFHSVIQVWALPKQK